MSYTQYDILVCMWLKNNTIHPYRGHKEVNSPAGLRTINYKLGGHLLAWGNASES